MPPKQNHDTVSPFQWQLDPVKNWQPDREASQLGGEHTSHSAPLCDHLSIVKMACDDMEDVSPGLDCPYHPGVTFIPVPLHKHRQEEPSPHPEDDKEDPEIGICHRFPLENRQRMSGCVPPRPPPTPKPAPTAEEEEPSRVIEFPPSWRKPERPMRRGREEVMMARRGREDAVRAWLQRLD